MASPFPSSSSSSSLVLLLLLTLASISSSEPPPQAYVIYVSKPPRGHLGSVRQWHESFLLPSKKSSLLYSFRHVISGFTATLTLSELDLMSSKRGFLHAEPNRVLNLHTTHSPSFLGLNSDQTSTWNTNFQYGKGVIIGVLDTGVNPSHPSFHGLEMPPPPSKWKGECMFTNTSVCNNKLIGARNFEDGAETSSPFDSNGHGTHTASTAAGQFIANASVLGNALGTAVGIAPGAHIAVYKVCGSNGCPTIDILAGVDTAVDDGVDVISMSLGGREADFYSDPSAGAVFGAVAKGVFVSASAGNSGPSSITVANTAPWFLTVGASTMNRRIRAVAKLGNGVELEGESAYQPPNFPANQRPLVYPRSSSETYPGYCLDRRALRRIGVRGKIVVCLSGRMRAVQKGELVKNAGAAAMILVNSQSRGDDTYTRPFTLPATLVTYKDGLTIINYISSSSGPTATIDFEGTVIGGSIDPAVASFSSRGPSRVNPGILKPDVIGPGVNVLAAWPVTVGPYPLYPAFNFLSGTSMSCPHLSGIAALLKSSHPDWSPAMIKSAIITTTYVANLGGNAILDQASGSQADFYQMGAGHVDPTKADDPGLVYDIGTEEYISYLCALGYTDRQVSIVVGESVKCSEKPTMEADNLNYPTFAVSLTGTTKDVSRVVTNVGEAGSSYYAYVVRPYGTTVAVTPASMKFATAGEKKSYTVRFGINGTETANLPASFRTAGYLLWVPSDGGNYVKSPLDVVVRSSSLPLTVPSSSLPLAVGSSSPPLAVESSLLPLTVNGKAGDSSSISTQ